MSDLNELRTLQPCPPWCALPAGHAFDQIGDDLHRFHRHEVATVSADGARSEISVTVEQYESGQGVQNIACAPPAVCIYDYESAGLTAPEARKLAAALLNGADEWDRIAGGLVT